MQKPEPQSARRCAARAFLQSACGNIAAILLLALAGVLPDFPNWQLALLILTAAAAAALTAHIMN